jgi:excisionase family DNA binding protein
MLEYDELTVGEQPMQDNTEMLTVEDVAKQLKVHIKTVRHWIKTGELEAMDIGRGYRISRADLHAFIGSRKKRRQNSDDEPTD